MRKVFHIRKTSDKDCDMKHDSTSPILAKSTAEASSARLNHNTPSKHKRTKKEMIQNPVDTIKDTISGQSNHQAAANLVVQEDLSWSRSRLDKRPRSGSECWHRCREVLALQDLDRLIKARQALYVRWTVDRHVSKCRVLPRETFTKKDRSAFQRINNQGETETDWKAYGTHASLISFRTRAR